MRPGNCTYSCCFLGFFRGLISSGGRFSSSSLMFMGTCGKLSSLPSAIPGLEVAEIVVLPPELCPLPRESGRDGGEAGACWWCCCGCCCCWGKLAKIGTKFFTAFRGEPSWSRLRKMLGLGEDVIFGVCCWACSWEASGCWVYCCPLLCSTTMTGLKRALGFDTMSAIILISIITVTGHLRSLKINFLYKTFVLHTRK